MSTRSSNGSAELSPLQIELLNKYAGTYLNHKTMFPSIATGPRTSKVFIVEHTCWELRRAMLMSHMVNMTDTVKSLWFISPEGPDSFVFRFFDSHGNHDVWNFQWDDEAQTMVTTPRDPIPGIAHAVSYHVHEADRSYYGMLTMTNEAGEKVGHLLGHKFRQPVILGEIMLGWWRQKQISKVPPPVELQELDHLVGEWDAVFTRTPSIASGNGSSWTAKVSAEWVMDGHFLLCEMQAEKYESKTLVGYDANAGTYRCSNFPSIGQIYEYSGRLNEGGSTIEWACENPPPNVTRTSSTQRLGDDKVRVLVRHHNEHDDRVTELEIELTRAESKAADLPRPPVDITGRTRLDLAAF